MKSKTVLFLQSYTTDRYSFPIERQSPGSSGNWHDICMTTSPLADPDYVVVVNYPPNEITVNCDPERVWMLVMEPPIGYRYDMQQSMLRSKKYGRVFSSHFGRNNACRMYSHPAAYWLVNKSYDELIDYPVPGKTRDISWITSNLDVLPGHRKRLKFMQNIRSEIDFDLYGKGYSFVQDKWDALAHYKYSIAIENHRNDFYWTEKIADCFLSWTMPVYYGCSHIDSYFPKEAMIQIDIDDPDTHKIIHAAIENKAWEKGIDAISYARELVLNKYQLYPFISNEIRAFESRQGCVPERKNICLKPYKQSLRQRILRKIMRTLQAG